VDLVIVGVVVPHGELIKLTGDVIGCPRIDVPVGIDPVGRSGRRSTFVVGGADELSVEAFVTLDHHVSLLAT
jgi:hypothetical protein